MPQLAILSDVHGNIQALEAVLQDVAQAGCSQIWFGGDLVGYGADPAACVRLAMQVGCGGVLGNHDLWAMGVRVKGKVGFPNEWKENAVLAGLVHAADTLGDHESAWLSALPYFQKLPAASLVHASLDEPNKWNYIETAADALPSINLLRGRERSVVFCGHTHVQALFADPQDDRRPEKLSPTTFRLPTGLATVVTVGSVGQPRDDKGDPRAAWTLWDSESRIVDFRRTEYDISAAAAAISSCGLPRESAERLFGG